MNFISNWLLIKMRLQSQTTDHDPGQSWNNGQANCLASLMQESCGPITVRISTHCKWIRKLAADSTCTKQAIGCGFHLKMFKLTWEFQSQFQEKTSQAGQSAKVPSFAAKYFGWFRVICSKRPNIKAWAICLATTMPVHDIIAELTLDDDHLSTIKCRKVR